MRNYKVIGINPLKAGTEIDIPLGSDITGQGNMSTDLVVEYEFPLPAVTLGDSANGDWTDTVA